MEAPAHNNTLPSQLGSASFLTPERQKCQARLIRITSDSAVVSIPSADHTVKLSDKVTRIELAMQNQIYSAPNATVSNVINTGLELICELSFGASFLRMPSVGDELESRFWTESLDAFFSITDSSLKLPTGFKNAVLNIESYFHDLKNLLGQFEIQLRQQNARGELQFDEDLFKFHGQRLLDVFDDLHDRLEKEAQKIDSKDIDHVYTYLRKHIQPYFLCSPFGYITCVKPLGYAGDYNAVNMIVGNQLQGETLFGRFMNWLLLAQPPSEAHRNRIDVISTRLTEESARIIRSGNRIRILSIGCGPACEIQRFISESKLSDQADIVLVDFNEETLNFAKKQIEEAISKNSRGTSLKLVRQSVVQFLKNVSGLAAEGEKPEFDYVYCAGLLDYFNDRMCKKLVSRFYNWTSEGGLMTITNVASYKPFKYMLDAMLEWHLTYRDSDEMAKLIPDGIDEEEVRIQTDVTSVNLFLEIRKPEREPTE